MSINPAGTRAAFFTTEEQQPLPREIWALDGILTALAPR
jgi:hypothetical protein